MIASLTPLAYIGAQADLGARAHRMTDKIHLALLAAFILAGVVSAVWGAVKRKVIADHMRTQPQANTAVAPSADPTAAPPAFAA